MKKETKIKICVLVAIISVILLIDLLTKYLLDANLEYGQIYTIIPYLFNFKMVYNDGAAWGVLSGKQVFLIVMSIVFLFIFTFYYVKEKNKTWLLTVAYAFLVGGCLGNLYDRVVIRYVRDFIQFDFWQSFPVFNFADVFLSIGVVIFVIYLIIYFVKESKKSKILSKNSKNNGIKIENYADEQDFDEQDVDNQEEINGNSSAQKERKKSKRKTEKKGNEDD